MEELLHLYSKLIHRTGKPAKEERSLFRLYFINPFSAGLFGFAVFLFFEVLFSVTAELIGIVSRLNIGMNQIAIAGLGFVLQFILQFFKNFR